MNNAAQTNAHASFCSYFLGLEPDAPKVEILRDYKSRDIDGSFLRVVGSDHSITVTDTTHAGKRGKMVDNFSVYDLGDLDQKSDADELQRAILGAANYSEAREIAKKWIEDRQWTSYQERQEKGVRVQHHGFEDITHNTADLEITIRWDNFVICDMLRNYGRHRATNRNSLSVNKLRTWYKKNHKRVESMRFWQIVGELREAGLSIHTWCGMD